MKQFVQSFLKFINCDIEEDTVEQLRKMGAIVLKSVNGLNSDVDIVSQELNQQQTQTLVDYLYDQVLYICGLPTTTKGGGSTSDTGAAVLLRDGWQQCEARAQQTEKLYRKSEREFLRLVLRIMGDTRPDIDLKLSSIECKFTRRQHDNLQSKCQALSSLLQAGIHPEIAIATSGLFNDPMDVYKQSEEYLEKWKPVPMNANPALGEGGGNPEDVPPEEEDTEITEDEENVAEGGEKGEYSPVFYKKDRFTLLDGGTFWLTDGDTTKPGKGWDAKYNRICTWGHFRHKVTGKKICFMNIHFDHRGVQARIESAKMMLDYIKKNCKGMSVIVSGDYNVTQTSDSYKVLADSKILKDSYDAAKVRFAPTGTFNGFNPKRYTTHRIDHLFVSKGTKVSRWGVLTYHYYLDKYAIAGTEAPAFVKGEKREVKCISDHYAIQAFIKL